MTRFRFRMHELGPVSIRRWNAPAAATAPTLRAYRDSVADAPRELTTALIASRDALHLRGIATGPDPFAHAVLEELAFPDAVPDPDAETSFLALQRASDDVLPWGRRYYSKGGFLAELNDRSIEVIAEALADAPMPEVEVYCLQLGGAVGHVDDAATAYSGRRAGFYWISQGAWDSPRDDERAIAWCRATAGRLESLSMAANYVNEQADTGIAKASYGVSTYGRLAELKARYDPANVFRLNQNVEPGRR